jgi:thiamine pyrophosphate-dependent acetolactate synthase large subunit-like protein
MYCGFAPSLRFIMLGAASSRPKLAEPLSSFVRRTRISFFNTQMGKGSVTGGALTSGDYVHRAVDHADLIIAIGHDTVEKPPFLMGPTGPKMIHVASRPATIEQVYFPHAKVVGDPDFVQYAESYGATGHRVKRTGDLVPTLEAAFKDTGVHLITVPIDYAENTRILVEELSGRVPEPA